MRISQGDKEGLKVCFTILAISLMYGAFSWFAYAQTHDLAWFVILSLSMPLFCISVGGILFLLGKMAILWAMGKCQLTDRPKT